jgi:hypothetical protein
MVIAGREEMGPSGEIEAVLTRMARLQPNVVISIMREMNLNKRF